MLAQHVVCWVLFLCFLNIESFIFVYVVAGASHFRMASWIHDTPTSWEFGTWTSFMKLDMGQYLQKFKKYVRIATFNWCHYLTISLLLNPSDPYTQQKQHIHTASHEKHSFQSTLLFGVQCSIGHSVNEKTRITASLSHLELFEWHFWCLPVLRVCLGDWPLLKFNSDLEVFAQKLWASLG